MKMHPFSSFLRDHGHPLLRGHRAAPGRQLRALRGELAAARRGVHGAGAGPAPLPLGVFDNPDGTLSDCESRGYAHGLARARWLTSAHGVISWGLKYVADEDPGDAGW